MTVSSNKIITKMMEELERAKAVDGNMTQMKIHLGKVQVLNELLLEDVSDQVKHQLAGPAATEITPAQVMSSEPNRIENQSDSIFDF